MPEYVYAVHEFTPENPDEVPLKVGERIEVVEKDDQYGDGWWQGRNSAGQVGLFPQSYTSSNPPATSSTLAVLESTNASSASSTVEGVALKPNTLPNLITSETHDAIDPILSHSTEDISPSKPGTNGVDDGEVMKATMTDVQKAIEQLGRGGRDDGARSFSFASSRSQSTDHSEVEDDTDRDEGDGEGHGFGWSKGARTKLAMKAQQANEEREAREREASGTRLSSGPATPLRSLAPPIDVEMSDESEDEDEELIRPHSSRRSQSRTRSGGVGSGIPNIREEDEEQELPTHTFTLATPPHSRSASATMDFKTPPPPVITLNDQSLRSKGSRDSTAHIIPSEDFIVPSPGVDESELPTARADHNTFSAAQLSPSSPEESEPASPEVHIDMPSPVKASENTPLTGGLAMLEKVESFSASESVPTSTFATPAASVTVLPNPPVPTPTPSAIRVAEASQLPFSVSAPSGLPSPSASSFAGSMSMSSPGVQQTLTPATTLSNGSGGASDSKRVGTTEVKKDKPECHPSEWTVEQVVEWLRSKGFDEGVCDKFIEQEITGDVLLELDANVLKTEIGIVAFGKRARIVNAITELRRPPSIYESPSHTPARVTTPRSQTGQSLPYSHSHSASMQSSAQTASSAWAYSPMYAASAQGYAQSPGIASAASEDAQTFARDVAIKNGWTSNDVGKDAENEKEGTVVGLGLGLQASLPINGKDAKPRPTNLILSPSPSDSAIGSTAVGSDAPHTGDDERGAFSESETTLPAEMKAKKRLFWRSDSGSIREKGSITETASRHSKDASTPQSPPLATTPLSAASTAASPTDSKSEPADETASIVTRRTSKKRESVDGRKASDRLSLFGTSFTGTLGKSGKGRKPPPRLSTTVEKDEVAKHSHGHSTFSRIREKKSSSRPSTADGTTKDKEKTPQVASTKGTSESKDKDKTDAEKSKEKADKEKSDKSKDKDATVLRKRTTSTAEVPKLEAIAISSAAGAPKLKPGQSILEQIGTPDHEGWMRKKGDRYNTWKTRYFVLKGPHLYILRNKSKSESKIKGYINIVGYKVIADENVDPGRYGFRIVHDTDKTHYFSSDEQFIIREWMKSLMKATITRDYADLVVSSCNIPTIPLTVAQAMNPAPRPPSPGARAATQRAMRPENPHQLSQRDAQVLLMGVQTKDKATLGAERARLDSFFTNDTVSTNGTEPASPKVSVAAKVPPRPSRELRRLSSQVDSQTSIDTGLVEWANSHLPSSLQSIDPSRPVFGGLALLRLAEDIKGKPMSPRVPDSAFPSSPDDDKLDGLFRLFDFLLDNDVKMGTVSINDIRQGKREKIVQVLRALKAWEDKRKAIAQSLGPGSTPVGAYMAMAGPISFTS